MNDFSTLYPALLFPAIPLMMISFGNRYTSLAVLIRKIHDLIVVNHLSKKNAKHYLDQIKVLTQRLSLVRASQTLSGVSFILNLLSIYCSYIEKYEIALNFFGFGVSLARVLLFILVVLVFAVIHDSANRRALVGSDFNQIQTRISGSLKSLLGWNDP